MKTLAVLAVVVVVFVAVAAVPAWSQGGKEVVAQSASPGTGKQIAPPNLISAAFSGAPKWSTWEGRYKNRLLLRFDPAIGPLFLQVSIHWRNQNGEGDQVEDTIDLTRWAAEGAAYRNRTYGVPGEYTFTVTLRNIAGESTIVLPPLEVR